VYYRWAFYKVRGRWKAGGQGEGGNSGGTLITPIMGDENGEGEVIGCGHFRRRRGGGGDVTTWCQRRTTQQRAARRSGRPKAGATV
jgi:hypothetical protein